VVNWKDLRSGELLLNSQTVIAAPHTATSCTRNDLCIQARRKPSGRTDRTVDGKRLVSSRRLGWAWPTIATTRTPETVKRGTKLPKKPALGDQPRGPFGYLAILGPGPAGMSFLPRMASKEVTFKDLLGYLKEGRIEKLVIGDAEITGKFKADAPGGGLQAGQHFRSTTSRTQAET